MSAKKEKKARIAVLISGGCTNLQAIYLSSEDPSSTLVGRHLLDGTDAVLYVPAGALSAYRTDYSFSQYAERIYPYTE